jgi:hypothetical protein
MIRGNRRKGAWAIRNETLLFFSYGRTLSIGGSTLNSHLNALREGLAA